MLLVTQKGLNRDPELDKKIDRGVFPGIQGGPHEATIAGIAIALEEASRPEFKAYISQVVKNAKVLAGELSGSGLNLSTGGTDNHMMIVDLKDKGISGKEAAVALEEAGIVVNANTVPYDPGSAYKPSGIRLGTPAVTTRGMKEEEMRQIAGLIDEVLRLKNPTRDVNLRVKQLCNKYPVQ
jgi:glycine hydroxymethyltransferase